MAILPAMPSPLRSQTARTAAALALLAAVFFAPALLGGRVLAPPGDGVLYYYPMRVHVAEVLRGGELPLWNPDIFSGFPLLADVEAGAFYPPNILFLFLPGPWAMNLVAMSSYVLAALFTWLYARSIGATRFGAAVSGIAYGASGFMVSHLGHASIVNAAAWFPLLLFFAERLRREVSWSGVAGGAVALALQVFAGHPQIAAYSLLASGLYVLFFAVAEPPPAGRARYLAAAAAAVLCGLALAACQIVPTAELTAQSNRAWISYEAFSEPALPPSHLLLFLFPCVFGGGSAGPYVFAPMGLSVAESMGYVGLVPLALALAAVPLARRDPYARFWLIVGVLALLMALGPHTPLHRALFLLPGYNRFRAPARNLMTVDLALAVLAGLAASAVPSLARSIRRSAVLLAMGVAGLAFWILRVGPGWTALLDPRAPLSLVPGALRPAPELVLGPVVVAALTAVVLFVLARRGDAVARRLVAVVLFADLGSAGQLAYGPFVCPTAASLSRTSPLARVLEPARGDLARARFLSLTPEERPEDFALAEPNSSMLRGLRSAGGNSSFVLSRYAALIPWSDLGAAGVDLSGAGKALDLLGVSRLVLADQALFPRPRVSVQGVGLDETDLGVRLARSGRDAAELELPGLRCTAIVLEATTVGGAVAAGQPLVRATAWTTDGRRIASILPAGRPQNPGTYRVRLDLDGAREVARIRLEDVSPGDALRLDRVILYDAGTGHALALGGEAPDVLASLRPVPHRLEVEFPPAEGSALVFVSAISGPTTLAQGQAMARVSAHTTDGAVVEGMLRAGEQTSEWAWERPDVRPKIRHRMAPVAESFTAEGGFRGHRYRGRLELGGRHRVDRLVVEHVGPDSSLYVDRVDLVDEAAGTETRLPIEAVELQPQATAPPGPRELVLALPPLPCTAVTLVSALHDATGVYEGQPVARVTLRTEDGPPVEAVMRAGRDTSEWAWDRSDVRPRVRHGRAPVAESFAVPGSAYEGHRYASRIELPGRRRLVELQVRTLFPMAGLELGRAVFEDGPRRSWSLPVSSLPAVLLREATVPRLELETPSVPATEIAVASRLSRSVAVEQGTPVALVRAWTTDGRVIEKPLRAGVDTSEWLGARPDVKARLRHGQAPVAFSAAAGTEPGSWYLGRIPLDGRVRLGQVAIEALDPEAVVSVARVSLHDADTGTSAPLSALRSLVSSRSSWRPLCAAMGDTIYENPDALPRAWLVRHVVPVAGPDALAALQGGRLPDGTAFEPRRVALVEDGNEVDFGPLDPRARVEVTGGSPNRSTFRTRCRTPAFLVLAEADYPGWRATVDGVPTPIARVDHALRGLRLAAGDHRVELEYRPRSFTLGMALSALAVLGLAIGGRGVRRQVWPPLAAAALLPVLWLAVAAAPPPVSRARANEVPPPQVTTRDGLLELAAVSDGSHALGEGWWPAEAWATGLPGRWTAGAAVVRLERRQAEGGLAVDMTLDSPSGETAGRIEVGGRTLRVFQAPNGRRREVVDIAGVAGRVLEVRIVADRPFASPLIPVGREQGVFVHSVGLLPAALAAEIEPGRAEDGRPELASGWWDAEARPSGPGGRWTGERAVLRLGRREAEDALVLDLTVDDPRGTATGRVEVEGGPVRELRAGNGRRTVTLDIGAVPGRVVEVRLVADHPFVPRQYDPSAGDGRTLGFFVHSARLGSLSRCP